MNSFQEVWDVCVCVGGGLGGVPIHICVALCGCPQIWNILDNSAIQFFLNLFKGILTYTCYLRVAEWLSCLVPAAIFLFFLYSHPQHNM